MCPSMIILKEFEIMNFKSFKKVQLKFRDLNVLIGPNSSGKTNFLECFKLLKKAFSVGRPYYPLADWWSYKNIVYKGDELLPIIFNFVFKLDNYTIKYMISFGFIDRSFSLLEEEITIENIVTLKRRGDKFSVNYNNSYVDEHGNTLFEIFTNLKGPFNFNLTREEFFRFFKANYDISFGWGIFNFPIKGRSHQWWGFRKEISESSSVQFRIATSENIDVEEKKPSVIIMTPALKTKNKKFTYFDIFEKFSRYFNQLARNSIYLHNINPREICQPRFPSKSLVLDEDGKNLFDILYYWYLSKNGLPDLIEDGLSKIFPGFQLNFSLMEDRRVFVKIIDNNGIELFPPNIPDGLIKVLVILTAIELKPPLLLYDEIENSLHIQAIERILDYIKQSESKTIITTHSPALVDLVDLKDLLIVERKESSTLNRVTNIQELQKKLIEDGITHSEYLLDTTDRLHDNI